jgi:signal transduction histidine kinase
MNSIRANVRRIFGLALVFCWICGVGVVAAWTATTEHSIWDSKLQAFGTHLLLSIPAEEVGDGPFGPGLELPPEARREPENFAIQVWSGRDKLVLKTPAAPGVPFQPSFHNGFATLDVAGRTWRVYTISDRDGKASVQVATLQSVIDREMYGETLIALALMTAILLLVAALLVHALDRSLLPLAVIERALRRRDDFDLAPLPVDSLPVELRPLVTSFNHLLVQLDAAVTAERRFLGDAAHELRTPLSVLQAHVDVALHARTDSERDEALRMLQQGVRRSARMAEQLLDMARLDALSSSMRTAPLDLAQLVDHVMQEYSYHAQSLGCTLRSAAVPAPVEGNLDELAILLRNLVDNAVRFARDGGQVLVDCGTAPEGAWLSVADDGPGVPEAEHVAIFQRFYRLPGNHGRGSGIGLSLVAAIARLHGARIDTGDGLAGRGFTVRVAFPPPAPRSP